MVAAGTARLVASTAAATATQQMCVACHAPADATTSVSATLVRRFGAIAGESIQEFAVKADAPCGSTIGPITATRIGIRTVDVGIPILSMHSARELAGTSDLLDLARVAEAFFRR